MAKKRLPDFKNEAEEADWWAEHQDEMDDYLDPVPASDMPLHQRLGLPERGKPSVPISLRLPASDLELAKAIADEGNVPYQSLLKSLIHEGLMKEARAKASRGNSKKRSVS